MAMGKQEGDGPVDGEQEGECGHRLLSPGELLHVAEPFHGRHGVELEASQVRIFLVVQT